MKAYTDIEQSKKLAEILPIESADMHYVMIDTENEIYSAGLSNYIGILPSLPCWSLAALMNLLPSEFTEVGKYSTTIYEIKIRKYNLIEDVNLHQIAYGNYKWHEDGNSYWKDMINSGEKKELIDAVFQMICWLKENGKI